MNTKNWTLGNLRVGDQFKINGRIGTFTIISYDPKTRTPGYWHRPGLFRNVWPSNGDYGLIVKKLV